MQPHLPPQAESQRQLLAAGIDLFNQERFFECHEILEQAWLQAAGEQKKFLQGLIQVAVALHHLSRSNLVGARRLLEAGTEKLAAFAPHHEQVNVQRLLQATQSLLQAIESETLPPKTPLPKIETS